MTHARAKRSLGQNFLVDTSVVARIISAAGVQPGETVVEIGPGRGALTSRLRELSGRLVCIEKDDGMAETWRREFDFAPALALVHGDALVLRPSDLPFPGPYCVVANLPYNAAGRIALHLLEDWGGCVRVATLMFQREVAERIVAAPGTPSFGVLSVLVQSFAEAWLLFGVPPGAFRPVPKVQSAVVRLVPRSEPLWRQAGLDWEHFRRVVHAGFVARRKLVANSLAIGLRRGGGEIDPEAVLGRAGIDLSLRPDAVPLDGWLRLAAELPAGMAAACGPGTGDGAD